MTSAYYYNQQGAGVPMPQQRGMPGQIGINPAQGHFLQQQQQQQQFRNQAQFNDARKRSHNKTPRPNVPIAEEVEEPSGDELDDISARDIAMARYKRNHDYLSEIFTPYHADAIVPPSLDISFTKEELDKQMEEYTEKTKRHQTQYQHQLSSLQQEQTQFWEMMNQLNEATTLETIESTANALAKQMDLQIEHSANPVKVISIPGLQEEKPSFVQEMDTSMDMYFSDQRDQEESNDSFFNEMVNTEDMGN